jgi:hypothetical protein
MRTLLDTVRVKFIARPFDARSVALALTVPDAPETTGNGSITGACSILPAATGASPPPPPPSLVCELARTAGATPNDEARVNEPLRAARRRPRATRSRALPVSDTMALCEPLRSNSLSSERDLSIVGQRPEGTPNGWAAAVKGSLPTVAGVVVVGAAAIGIDACAEVMRDKGTNSACSMAWMRMRA